MSKRAKYIDVFFLVLIGIAFCLSCVRHFEDGFTVPVNTYLGFLCWLTVIIVMFTRLAVKRFFVSYLLICSTLNIISFTASSIAFGSAHLIEYKGFYFTPISINPVLLILSILYLICNGAIIKELYRKIFQASEGEMMEERRKEEKFYYEKFVGYNSDELDIVRKSFNDYPDAAKEAINRIMAEKES
jgi:hypothetical protein